MIRNTVELSGIICSDIIFSHAINDRVFLETTLRIERLSGQNDFIPLVIEKRKLNDIRIGDFVLISGNIRSTSKWSNEESKTKLVIYVFVETIERTDTTDFINSVNLIGNIKKLGSQRITILTNRTVLDFLMSVERPYVKLCDHIPCICWGRNARFASGLEVGTRLKVHGRIQSREYTKKLSDTESETRTAYEVSISKMEVTHENGNA